MKMDEYRRSDEIVTLQELSERLPSGTPPWVKTGLLSLTGMHTLNAEYAKLGRASVPDGNLFEGALKQLSVRVEVSDEDLSRVPRTGPTIVVSNHPFGAVDGLALGAAMLRRRSDVRIIANALLTRLHKLRPWFLDVEVFNAKRESGANARQLRAALRHLKAGGLVVIFPAGEVSHFQIQRGGVADAEWSSSVAMLARRSGATVVPCFFEGANSPIFQAAGLIHSFLRTALLPRELLSKRGTAVTMRIGRANSPRWFERFPDDATLTAWFRLRSYDLGTRMSSPRPRWQQPIAVASDSRLVRLELDDLPRSQVLGSAGTYRVYFARYSEIPTTLDEVARLREQTFRSVGEGTGYAKDLDGYDLRYRHLVVYDQERELVVGAYRMAFCDEILAKEGFSGLYTNTLFRFKSPMRQELENAIELGRSFIRPEYQRKPLALSSLWRGIGAVLARNPTYRRLVGPVSISRHLRGSSRRLLLAYLLEVQGDESRRRWVLPRNPIRGCLDPAERRLLESCRSVRELSRVIAELNEGAHRVPILLERYLELGAKVAAVSTDPAFGHCIDAYVTVELDGAPPAVLDRYMGETLSA